MPIIRIATRQSRLALVQAEKVATLLQAQQPDLQIVYVKKDTQGDRIQQSLQDQGGKGLFVKELQHALLNHQADIAVHSVKDMSVHGCAGLTLAAVLERDDPRDVLISPQPLISLQALPEGAVIGTASPRRQALIKQQRPDLVIKLLRGNVDTRLQKVYEKKYDAIVLAQCGLQRLGLQAHIRAYLSPETFVPAIGQGAIGVECRSDDQPIKALLHRINDQTTAYCIQAERAVNQRLNGDCFTPVGAYAEMKQNNLTLRAVVASLSGDTVYRSQASLLPQHAQRLGLRVAEDLLQQGAGKLLQ